MLPRTSNSRLILNAIGMALFASLVFLWLRLYHAHTSSEASTRATHLSLAASLLVFYSIAFLRRPRTIRS